MEGNIENAQRLEGKYYEYSYHSLMDSQNDQLRATDLEENIASYIGIADTWQSL